MNVVSTLYRHSLGLLTDLYQVTMACGYWKSGLAEREGVFHLTFRRPPFGGQFAVACGLRYVVDLLEQLRFDAEDLAYLGTLSGAGGRKLFPSEFLQYLGELKFRCDLDAVEEGTTVFAHEPIVRVRGPLLQCQLLETPLLNLVNFQTLVATKAARMRLAAGDEQLLEFGLRRAQGIDGGVTATRAAYIGGVDGTSNLLAGKLFDIPVRGTHAHSWVMAFDDELQAFQQYADVMPQNSLFLVDTYDTHQGVEHAIRVGRQLRERGFPLLGVRLDSGNMAELSIDARQQLDAAGFPDAAIVASGDLDEYAIADFDRRGDRVSIWGIGTRLATAYDQPALGGVYKLSAIRNEQGDWQDRVKLSEEEIKSSDPGILQVRRYERQGKLAGDIIYDERLGLADERAAEDIHAGRLFTIEASADQELASRDLLVPVTRGGEIVYDPPSTTAARERTLTELARLPAEVSRLETPKPYLVGRERQLAQLRRELIAATRARSTAEDFA